MRWVCISETTFQSLSLSVPLLMSAIVHFCQELFKINDSIINSLPKLIIWGKQDAWIPITVGSRYFNKPHTKTLLINNSGHCPMETDCNEVNNTITDFISKLEKL